MTIKEIWTKKPWSWSNPVVALWVVLSAVNLVLLITGPGDDTPFVLLVRGALTVAFLALAAVELHHRRKAIKDA